jgi:TRAP-type mannitol/chloroaromatic compound transport system permease small subunit
MPEPLKVTDEMVVGQVGRRPDSHGHLPGDMPLWMSHAIVAIDTFSLWVGRAVMWLLVPLMVAIVYEVAARYFFTAPTVWAYDISRMLYGAMFVLGAAYALSKGVHIRSDFLYRHWSVKTQGLVDAALYLVCYFPTLFIFLWVSADWAWLSVSRAERGTDTAWMPLLGPLKSCVPIGIVLLIVQGVSELLKALYAARKGEWPK